MPMRSSTSTSFDLRDPVDGAVSFTRYCRERLGVTIPVGPKTRGEWYGFLKEEMEAQGWDWGQLQRAVDYIVEHGETVRTIKGVLWFVEEALRAAPAENLDEVRVKAAEALAVETDEYWRRRLSLATGKALERVYGEWRQKCMST